MDLDAAADLEMRQHGQSAVESFGDGVNIGPRFGRRDQNELMAGIHKRLHHAAQIGAELLDKARIDIEFDDVALRVALQRLMESDLPRFPSRTTLR